MAERCSDWVHDRYDDEEPGAAKSSVPRSRGRRDDRREDRREDRRPDRRDEREDRYDNDRNR